MSNQSIKNNLKLVRKLIDTAIQKRDGVISEYKLPRLVAVSKTKPVVDLIEAYSSGQKHFGENYIQELVEKANNKEILENCPGICWHFIGHLQSNKVKKLTSIPNLYMVETVDSIKLANALNISWTKTEEKGRLKIMIQVNTSEEENKSGVEPAKAFELAKHIIEHCCNLEMSGLMTIGAYDYDTSLGPNPDFLKLVDCHKEVCEKLNLSSQELELSMGMSSDFEHAIALGSTNVRIGSTIFGSRSAKP